ncbi:MAG: alpha/beta hydrolase [Phycisphaerales bacterium]|nr:alpha/beta hydrolase [Phycisphaerales bacterium]
MLVTLAGCSAKHPLMPTPNLYVSARENPFTSVRPELQTSTIDVLYATDRRRVPTKNGSLKYDFNRSTSLAFGSCVVDLAKGMSWDQLVADSTVKSRQRRILMRVASTTELGRFPPTPTAVIIDDAGVRVDPHVQSQIDATTEALRQELRRYMAVSPRKEVLIYVHGYNNTFEDAVFRAAELAHFLGREMVPIAYSWPAGAKGLLQGYTRDRESGEFTIFHLKAFLRSIASCPEIERINLIAHSRGADVITSALRELYIESRAAGRDFRREYKIHNAIMVAADLDLEVSQQRLAAEHLGLGLDRITIYVSQSDDAIGLAEWLYGSVRRLGQLTSREYFEMEKIALKLKSTAVINVKVKSDFFGHGYFHANPAVSSDLIMLLRYDRDPGSANGRPLKQIGDQYWEINDSYLRDQPVKPLSDAGNQ